MDTPYNMLIAGPTLSGKTRYLLNMIESDYKNHFDFIVLVCPTFSWNKTYQEWRYINDEDVIPIECDHDNVDKLLHIISEIYKGTNTLITLDDCACSKAVKNRTGELVRLAFSARHYGISIIVITQQITSIAKPYRENISKLTTFYNANRSDMKFVFDDYLNGLDKNEFDNIVNKLKQINTQDLRSSYAIPTIIK